jgi:hypothetical protein
LSAKRRSHDSREEIDRVAIGATSREFLIAEDEDEVSYIDSMHLEVETNDHPAIKVLPIKSELRERDGRYVKLTKGERLAVTFDTSDMVQYHGTCVLAVTGYYIPLSLRRDYRQGTE